MNTRTKRKIANGILKSVVGLYFLFILAVLVGCIISFGWPAVWGILGVALIVGAIAWAIQNS